MDNIHHKSSFQESSLLNSLNLHTTSTTSFLTSTTDQDSTLCNLLNNDRRRAIIPTPHRPTIVQRSISFNHSDEEFTSKPTCIMQSNQHEFNNEVDSCIETQETPHNITNLIQHMNHDPLTR